MTKYILLLLFINQNSIAGEKIVRVESDTYIAVGESENSSEQLAKQDACNAARRELISFIFGIAYQINQNMVRSLGILDYSQDVSSNSGEIIIRGASQEIDSKNEITKCILT